MQQFMLLVFLFVLTVLYSIVSIGTLRVWLYPEFLVNSIVLVDSTVLLFKMCYFALVKIFPSNH